MKALRSLNKYLVKYKYYLISGILFTVISNVFGIVPAQMVRYAFDLVKDTMDIYWLYAGFGGQTQFYALFATTILLYGVLILVMALLKGFFLFLVRQTLIVMSRNIEFDLKNEIYAHYQTLPLAFYRRNNTGDLMARISEDVSRVRMYVGPAIMYGINLVSLSVMVIAYMASVSGRLTLFVLLPLPFLSLSIYVVNSIILRRSEEIQKSLSSLSTFVQEAFSGIRVLKAYVREADSTQRFTAESDVYKHKSLQLNFVNSLFFPLIMALVGLSTVLTVYVGGREVMAGHLTMGNIAEFILYVNMLTWPVAALGWTTSQVQRAAASQVRINEFLDTHTDLVSAQNLAVPIKGHIRFDHVTFVYPDSGTVALADFSAEVHPGESLAILGTTGSGKTTVANLLCRLYDASGGTIYLDERPIRDYALASLRGQIGYVPQDVFLFSDSLRNNIAFGNPGLSEARMVQASQDADLFDNIAGFPDGFDTRLGERGITLSGGQKQRLSIARALAREPQILILDDCLSAVDTQTENIILNNLQRLMQNRTSVIISHRVSSAKLADKILVLDEGRVVEQGTHETLLEQNGIYKDLYDKQLQTEEV